MAKTRQNAFSGVLKNALRLISFVLDSVLGDRSCEPTLSQTVPP